MKTNAKIFYLSVAILLLAGCGGNANEESATDASEDNSISESAEKDTTEPEENVSTNEEEADQEDEVSIEKSDREDTTTDSDEESLSQYSNEQIEYARIWLQLGANQEIDGLYVQEIPAGTPLNADDETSAAYPEDVIQLAGSRLVDGSVTYSGNGDGTINVYNVPLRWDGQYPAGEDFYKAIIENTELVAVDTGDDEEVIRLIELQQ